MDQHFDLVIRNGLIVDGSGGEPYHGDVAITGGTIAQVGSVAGTGGEEIDAASCLVTPGFVDVHTHYDGQFIWSNSLQPSSSHGVTTVVAGNCGVGFAPCRAHDRDLLVKAMEGVEDIPEIVMTQGLTWNWETYGQYLDAVEARSHDINIASYVPHSALRIYAMGDRGTNREVADPAHLETMTDIVRQGVKAGAMGVATSRVGAHRRSDGEYIPSFEAAEEELHALASGLRGSRAVFQLVPELQHENEEDTRQHIAMIARISERAGVPVTFTMLQSNRYPDRWRKIMGWIDDANGRPGVDLRPQIFPRPVGMVLSHELSNNPFLLCPSYRALEKLPIEARVKELRKPEVRARLVSEEPGAPTLPLSLYGRMFDRMFELGDTPNYEPSAEQSVTKRAKRLGVSPAELAYDILLKQDGKAQLYAAFINFGEGNLDFFVELFNHPATVLGLGDGGAHYGLICDASYPTFLLTHWTRDRKGERLSLPAVIKALAADPAALMSMSDRGRIAPGMKADINVIDYANLRLHSPEVRHDLPGGGRRLHQRADGYRYTLVNGTPIVRDGVPTGLYPGRLLRSSRIALAAAN